MNTIEVVAAIIIKDGKVFATQRGYGPWKGWSQSLNLNEHEAAAWLTRDTLRSVRWLPADEDLISHLENEI